MLGAIAIRDTLKPEAKAAIAHLHAMGLSTIMMSGDNAGAAKAIAAEAGISDVRSGLRPQDKAQEIERLRAAGRVVAMVGDGVNDAPSLAAADVGFAMGGGADVAMNVAGITLMNGNPLGIADAVSISRATTSAIRRGLFWAFAFNLVGIPLAAAGQLTPVFAGAAMAFSSVAVVLNALWLRRWRRLTA